MENDDIGVCHINIPGRNRRTFTLVPESYCLQVFSDRIVIIGSVPVSNLKALTDFADAMGFDGLTCKRNEQECFSFVKLNTSKD